MIAPLLAPNDYVVGVLARICLYAMLALGLNIVVGFAGLLDIGYVAFFGIGSYVYAFLASPHFGLHLPFMLVMVVVTIAAAIAGILIGAPTLRLRGDYLAIVTLGFGEITYLLLVNLDRPINITGGPSGIIRSPQQQHQLAARALERFVAIDRFSIELVDLEGDADLRGDRFEQTFVGAVERALAFVEHLDHADHVGAFWQRCHRPRLRRPGWRRP